MTTFPNAPAPHGALFDNAPTVATPRPLCRDYVDGVVSIWANGRTQRGRCRADCVMTAQAAREALALKTKADDETPADVTRRIAKTNRL